MADAAMEGLSSPDERRERHASNLELFLDLVFVFAVTQIASTTAHDLGARSIGEGLLLAWLVWWQWSQFTWAGTAVDLQARAGTRILVLMTIPATLLVAVAIPTAFGAGGPWFGVSYFLVQTLVLSMQGWSAVRNPTLRPAYVRFAAVAILSPTVVVIGGYANGNARTAWWIVATVIPIIGAWRGARGVWALNPVHFAERHALFVIIALGEVLVTAGSTASEHGLDANIALGVLAAVGTACVYWWSYFAFIPDVGEFALRSVEGPARAVRARDLFTFGHFPIVVGIVAYAVVVHSVVAAPTDHIDLAHRILLAASVALLFGGYLSIQYRVVHRLAPERVVAIVVIAVLVPFAWSLPGFVVVAGVGIVLGITQGITWRKFQAGAIARETTARDG